MKPIPPEAIATIYEVHDKIARHLIDQADALVHGWPLPKFPGTVQQSQQSKEAE
jgi:hypothetical protein